MKSPKILDIVDVAWTHGIEEMIVIDRDPWIKDKKGKKVNRIYTGVFTGDKTQNSFEHCQIVENHGSWKKMIKDSMLKLIDNGC